MLRTILMHYGACCASTSALERIFSKMEKVWGARVNNANTSHIRDLLELMEPLTEDEMRKTTEIAQYIWRLYYPGGYRKKVLHLALTRASRGNRSPQGWQPSIGAAILQS